MHLKYSLWTIKHTIMQKFYFNYIKLYQYSSLKKMKLEIFEMIFLYNRNN